MEVEIPYIRIKLKVSTCGGRLGQQSYEDYDWTIAQYFNLVFIGRFAQPQSSLPIHMEKPWPNTITWAN